MEVAHIALAEFIEEKIAKLFDESELKKYIFPTRRINASPAPIYIVNHPPAGPGPLTAIINCLILKNKFKIKTKTKTSITLQDVMKQLIRILVDANKKKFEDDKYKDNILDNLFAVAEALPSLLKELEINIYFNSPTSFERTAATSVYKYLDLRLFHAIAVKEKNAVDMLSNYSYNDLLDIAVRADIRSIASEAATSDPSKAESENKSNEDKKQKSSSTNDEDGIHTSDDEEMDKRTKSKKSKDHKPTKTKDEDEHDKLDYFETESMINERLDYEYFNKINNEKNQNDQHESNTNIEDTPGHEDTRPLEELIEEEKYVGEFLKSIAEFITVDGYNIMNAKLKENEIAVLFRAYQFDTIIKQNDAVYSLVLTNNIGNANVLWEMLDPSSKYLVTDSSFTPIEGTTLETYAEESLKKEKKKRSKVKVSNELKELKVPKESKIPKESKASKESKIPKESKASKDEEDENDAKHPKDFKAPKKGVLKKIGHLFRKNDSTDVKAL